MMNRSNYGSDYLAEVCSQYISKDANGIYKIDESWDRSEARSWNVDYSHATSILKTMIRHLSNFKLKGEVK